MKKSLLMSVLLAATLAACSNNAVKEKPAAPVVENSNSSVTKVQPSAPSKEETASTSPATQMEVSGNPLKDPNNILSKRSIYFDFDKDEVKAEYRPLVEAHAKYLATNPNAKVIFQGNADSRGSREYNLSLGQRRAVAVKKAVNLLGAQDKQIETVSYGEEKAKECKDETCYQQDRRVEIVYENE